MDIRFFTCIDKNTAYCLLIGSESGSFGHRSSSLSSKENKATGMIADNQIYYFQKNNNPHN
jgi:hypothetical protein